MFQERWRGFSVVAKERAQSHGAALILRFRLRAEDIPDFVSAILAAGAPICAIGHDIYLICETEVPDEMVEQVVTQVQEICNCYGPREHLRLEIVAHLRSLGRYVDLT